jgi:hypothetical protein
MSTENNTLAKRPSGMNESEEEAGPRQYQSRWRYERRHCYHFGCHQQRNELADRQQAETGQKQTPSLAEQSAADGGLDLEPDYDTSNRKQQCDAVYHVRRLRQHGQIGRLGPARQE